MEFFGNVARQVRGYRHHLCLLIVLLVFVAFAPQPTLALDPPYPPSPVIKSLTWDFSSLSRAADGSDLFPLTGAADGNLYTAWGDGWGFSESGDKQSLGVSRVSGSSTSYSGTDLWFGTGKAHGLIAIDGVLYIVITEQDKWRRGKVGRSTDYGHTWTFSGGSFANSGWTFVEPGGAFAAPALLQFGEDYQGARDSYVYGYSEKVRETIQPDIVMFRVPKDQLMARSAYEFFAGLDSNGNPTWTADIDQMQPVFTDPNGVGWGVQAMYHPVLRRYLLTVRHDDSGGWGIFDAPEPWGPWTTVAYYDQWIDAELKFMFSFNQKWMSSDGKTLWMVFSGTGEYDAFNVMQATLSTALDPPYPPSPVIKSLTWDFSSLSRAAVGSDLFPLTGAADGNLYTAWGDGWGFSESGDRQSLGVSRVSGSSTSYSGTDLWFGTGKAHGLIAIDGVFYIVITEQDKWRRGKVGRSTDYGHTWTFSGGAFEDSGWTFAEPGGAFAAPALLQFGEDYQGARDSYVYGYSEKVRETFQPAIVMFRVPKDQLMTRSAYEFFAGLDSNGNPTWTADIDQMQPVFTDSNGVGWGIQAMYHPVLRRYLLTVRHDDSGGWGIFDAPEPWGPWTTVAYYDQWIDAELKFTFSFNQKWMSSDGKTLWMVFSGTGEYDAFNVMQAILSTDDPAGVVFAVNAGGPQYDANGILYEADTRFTGGSTYTKQVAIADTQDEVLYQSVRYGDFSYAIPLPNGDYVVTLKFAELYWTTAGKRVFDVTIEGTEVLSNLDLVAKVGPTTASDVAVSVHVQDGVLDISFHADVDAAMVSAIVVEATDEVPPSDETDFAD